MRPLALAVVLLLWGCDEAPVPKPPPAIPFRQPDPVPAVAVPEVARAAPAEPTPAAGLTRSKVGDQLVYSWSLIQVTQAAMAKAFAANPAVSKQLGSSANMGAVVPPAVTGRLTITRVEPATPFTFLVELESGNESKQQAFTYDPEVDPRQVTVRVDADAAKTATPAAGQTFQTVQVEGKRVDPGPPQLALAGGLVSDTRPANGSGELSVALQKVTTGKLSNGAGKPRGVDSFETPLEVALRAIDPFLAEVRDARQVVVHEAVVKAASACLASSKATGGRLDLQTSNGKVMLLLWNGRAAPAAFDKCLKARLKRLKLPEEMMAVSAELIK